MTTNSVGQAIQTARDYVRSFGIPVLLQAGLYPFRRAYHEGRSAVGGSRLRGVQSVLQEMRALLGGPSRAAAQGAGAWIRPGRVLSWRREEGETPVRVTLDCERARIELAVLASDLVRVRARPPSEGPFPPPFSYAVARETSDWPPAAVAIDEDDRALSFNTQSLRCRVDLSRTAVSFHAPDGALIHGDAAGLSWDEAQRRVRSERRLGTREHVYGLGEKTTAVDKRGLSFDMWNRDPPNYRPGDDPIYSNIPFLLGLVEAQENGGRTRGYGLFVDHASRGRFDLNDGIRIEHGVDPGGDLHRSYFFYGPRLSDVLDRYTELTGRPAMLPMWALGYHQNRWSYVPEARVREIAAKFRQRRIPCEAIHLDIDYMDGFRSFTWDAEHFPDPAGLIADLHEQGYRVVNMIDPGIKVDQHYAVYRDGLRQGAFCAYPDGTPFRGPVWPGECVWPDFTSPRVRRWWGALYRSQVALGVDGFWNDMNEPSVFGHGGDTMSEAVRHDWEGIGAGHNAAHNLYGMQMARASVEGLRALRPDERPLVISRSVWAGSQRTCTHWLGDNYATWEALRNVPQLVINMGLSGMPFTGPDTGGFVGTPSPELLVRWNQLSAFMPFFRNHSNKTSADQEPWALGESCERLSRAAIELRYQLLPYFYTALWQSTQTGMPLVRPLFLAFQDDAYSVRSTDGRSPDDAFMVGDALLVAPVYTEGQRRRTVTLPPERWIDFWEDRSYAGGQTVTLDAPLERIPVLVRAGSVVPTWPVVQHTGEILDQDLTAKTQRTPRNPQEGFRPTLHVYAGTGRSVLYEDDGHTWAHEEGAYRLTTFTCALEREADGETRLTVQRTTEDGYTPGYDRIEVAVHGLEGEVSEIQVDGQRAATRALPLSVDWFHELEIRTCPLAEQQAAIEKSI